MYVCIAHTHVCKVIKAYLHPCTLTSNHVCLSRVHDPRYDNTQNLVDSNSTNNYYYSRNYKWRGYSWRSGVSVGDSFEVRVGKGKP